MPLQRSVSHSPHSAKCEEKNKEVEKIWGYFKARPGIDIHYSICSLLVRNNHLATHKIRKTVYPGGNKLFVKDHILYATEVIL